MDEASHILSELKAMRSDMDELKEMRADVSELKAMRSDVNDLKGMRADVNELKAMRLDVSELKGMRADMNELKNGQNRLETRLENLQKNLVNNMGLYTDKIIDHFDDKTEVLNKRVYQVEIGMEHLNKPKE